MKFTLLPFLIALIASIVVLPVVESRQDPAYDAAVSAAYPYQDSAGAQDPYGAPNGRSSGYGGSNRYFDDQIGGRWEPREPAGYRELPPRGDYPGYGMPWDEEAAVFPHYRREEDIGAPSRPSGYQAPAVRFQGARHRRRIAFAAMSSSARREFPGAAAIIFGPSPSRNVSVAATRVVGVR